MRKRTIRELMAFSESGPSIVRADATLREVAELLLKDHSTREVYLVDDANRFRGVITLRRFAHFVFTHHVPDQSSTTELLDLISVRNAGDLAIKRAASVPEDATLEQLLDVMFSSEVDELPVIDARGVIVGNIGVTELIAPWHADTLNESETPGGE